MINNFKIRISVSVMKILQKQFYQDSRMNSNNQIVEKWWKKILENDYFIHNLITSKIIVNVNVHIKIFSNFIFKYCNCKRIDDSIIQKETDNTNAKKKAENVLENKGKTTLPTWISPNQLDSYPSDKVGMKNDIGNLSNR